MFFKRKANIKHIYYQYNNAFKITIRDQQLFATKSDNLNLISRDPQSRKNCDSYLLTSTHVHTHLHTETIYSFFFNL